MAQIFVFGSSTPYGVGGSMGGWPDLLKQKLHEQMYQSKTLPVENHEIYNLCVPGATIADIERRFVAEVESYSKPGLEQVIVFMLGGNDAKAEETPRNFVNTPENFYRQMKQLVKKAKTYSEKVVIVGMKPVDESKTTPKINPNTGGKSYFENERIHLFDQELANLAQHTRTVFVPIFDAAQKLEWTFNFDDGLHPNTKGHKWLLEQVWIAIESMI